VSEERQSNEVRNKEVRRGPKPSKRSRTHPWPASSARAHRLKRPLNLLARDPVSTRDDSPPPIAVDVEQELVLVQIL